MAHVPVALWPADVLWLVFANHINRQGLAALLRTRRTCRRWKELIDAWVEVNVPTAALLDAVLSGGPQRYSAETLPRQPGQLIALLAKKVMDQLAKMRTLQARANRQQAERRAHLSGHTYQPYGREKKREKTAVDSVDHLRREMHFRKQSSATTAELDLARRVVRCARDVCREQR